jgi:hypothetical protein
MWVRNQQRDRLIDVNEFSIIESFNEIDLFNDCKKRFETTVNPVNRRARYAFEKQEIVEVREIDWYEFYEVEKEKHRNDYLGWLIKSADTVLATYPTKERCLEVLDEIQQAMIGKLMIPFNGQEIHHLPIVYQMPEV